MTQAYSDPSRESEPHALPNIEIFHHDCTKSAEPCPMGDPDDDSGVNEFECQGIGWYWQACFPGCMPDGDPMGPFETEAEALADAQSGNE